MTYRFNRNMTKYLTSTRKVWIDGEFRKQKGMKHVKVYDVLDSNDILTKYLVIHSKTGETLEELSPSPLLSFHQMDFIRLRNEMDSFEKTVKGNMFKKLWKPILL